MGLIIDGRKVSLEARNESFYIQDLEKNLGDLNVIELGYEVLPELEKLLEKLKETERYKEWLLIM